jgi:hypothetical protein
MRRLTILALVAGLIYPLNASAAIKPGDACKKIGITSTVKNFKYTCIKSGKKLLWNNGVPISKTTPSSNLKEGDSCSSAGQQITNSDGILECRYIAKNKLKFFQLSLSPAAPGFVSSPECLET